MIKKSIIIACVMLFCLWSKAQEIVLNRIIEWKPNIMSIENERAVYYLHFTGAEYDDFNTLLPSFHELLRLNAGTTAIQVSLENLRFSPLSPEQLKNISHLDNIREQVLPDYSIRYMRKQPFARIQFVPLRKNPASGEYEKLTGFTIRLTEQQDPTVTRDIVRDYADHSVLKTGRWVKIKISQDGIYRITYADLVGMGFSNPKDPRVFGYGGGMLPEMNNVKRHDDLVENALWIEKGSDGIFNSGDYILFFAKGPVRWKYDSTDDMLVQQQHLYTDNSYYFVTTNNGIAKTIETMPLNSNPETHIVTTFTDYRVHERDSLNITKSGQLLLGEHFDIKTSYHFSFSFPNLDQSAPLRLKTHFVSRSSVISTFSVSMNGTTLITAPINGIDLGAYTYALNVKNIVNFYSSSEQIPLVVNYKKGNSLSEGWMDYILLNARRRLIMYGEQMLFRDIESVGSGNVCLFTVTNTNSSARVWDVTDPVNPRFVQSSLNGSTLTFKAASDSLREYILFNGSYFMTPVVAGEVSNQDLHGLSQPDMIIVAHTDFAAYANQLADIHRNHDGFNVIVVFPDQIYNEFSSGAPDVSAIRDFIKMFYDRAGSDTTQMPRYVLLFGDGSYYNKSNVSNNTNYILTYQSSSSTSLSFVSSFVSDDYFAILDNNEGGGDGEVDAGVGRIPVKSPEEASDMLNKIIHYMSSEAMGEWRNVLCFLGDDDDGNMHMSSSDDMAIKVAKKYPQYNITKIYLDAYPQTYSSAGQGYPEATRAVNDRMKKGTFILNYMGHGNELWIAHEHVLGNYDVNKWDNFDMLPFIITASCEVSRYDDYARTSIGENMYLNPQGGAIAMLTTTRLVYASANATLNDQFYNYVFEKNANGEYYRLGDIIRFTKNKSGSTGNKKNFTLLGDPALQLAYPQHRVVTSSINQKPVSAVSDTLHALSKVTITGSIQDVNGNKLDQYNGVLYPMVFDKEVTVKTLGNSGASPFSFSVQNNILYKGKSSVTNGEFSFSFIVPKDIAYNYGKGKISYYAENSAAGGKEDANGSYKDIVIGGSSDTLPTDNTGPSVGLFMNDTSFVYGGITDENPKLLAFVSDLSGINTIGNGIGHDISAILDGDTYHTIVLNDFYEAELDNYQKGKVEYFFSDLTEGHHSLKFRICDVYNNSAEDDIDFIVSSSAQLALDHIFNYPNPFTTHTSFYFDHNQPGRELNVLIRIFTVSGKLVKTLNQKMTSDGYRSSPVEWDGLDDYGDKIGKGVYIYQLKVLTDAGDSEEKFEKLVILR